jgi:LAO/AO transport system kinase
VALAPGMGDGVQAAKAGILEIADAFVINKADASGAGKLESELRGMLELGQATRGRSLDELLEEHPDLLEHHPELADDADGLTPAAASSGWWPPIVRTVAVRGEGIAEVVDAFDAHASHLSDVGEAASRRRQRALHTIREIALEAIRRRFARLGSAHAADRRPGDEGDDPLLAQLAQQVADREVDPYAAADQLLDALETTPA